MKKINYIHLTLITILIITLSLTWKGILGMLNSTICNEPPVSSFKSHSILNGKYEFKLPSEWSFKEQSFSGGEILYHGDFNSKPNELRGIVEVWDINMPLINFLKQSAGSITGVVEFKNYRIEPVKVGSYNGYLLDYSRLGSDNKYYHALEYFVQDGNRSFFRISFFTPENRYNEDFKNLTREVSSTLKIRE